MTGFFSLHESGEIWLMHNTHTHTHTYTYYTYTRHSGGDRGDQQAEKILYLNFYIAIKYEFYLTLDLRNLQFTNLPS